MAKKDDGVIVPAAGVVNGGLLDAWRFHFRYFHVGRRGLRVVALCTPPAWPFPRELRLNHTHFRQLRPIVGDRAKRLQAESLIRHAYQIARVPAPAWLGKKPMTLRAIVKRAAELRRTH
jgi:hypothetical protein